MDLFKPRKPSNLYDSGEMDSSFEQAHVFIILLHMQPAYINAPVFVAHLKGSLESLWNRHAQSSVRCLSMVRPPFSKISKTAGPDFMWSLHGSGEQTFLSWFLGHMTKMAAMPTMYGKKLEIGQAAR